MELISGAFVTILTNDSPSRGRKNDETMVICCAPVTCSITVQAPPDRISARWTSHTTSRFKVGASPMTNGHCAQVLKLKRKRMSIRAMMGAPARGAAVMYFRRIEAQRNAVAEYLNGGNCSLVKEFVEVESGKNTDRPKLAEAIKAFKRQDTPLYRCMSRPPMRRVTSRYRSCEQDMERDGSDLWRYRSLVGLPQACPSNQSLLRAIPVNTTPHQDFADIS
jgi:hypothetical protein